MKKLDKKRLRREFEEKRDIELALNRIRKLDEDINIRGIGILKVQLSRFPSYDEGESWDFREVESFIKIYNARINIEQKEYFAGYQIVENAEVIGEELIKFLQSVDLPISCDTQTAAICDGTSYQVLIRSGTGNSLTISWGEDAPQEWTHIIEKFMYFFEKLQKCKLINYVE